MITPEDFQRLAEKWILGATEAEWRCAVSRTYYAAFHAAREFFVALGFRVPRASVAHAYLWMRLANCGDPALARVGNDLNDLQQARYRGDYDFHLSFPQGTARQMVQLARSILQRLPAGLVEPTRTQVRDAMRDYERNVLRDISWQGP